MSTIHLRETSISTPEQLVAALTDFGPGRSELFSRSAADHLMVHSRGLAHADVTEGSDGAATPATPTRSPGDPTGRPTWTSS